MLAILRAVARGGGREFGEVMHDELRLDVLEDVDQVFTHRGRGDFAKNHREIDRSAFTGRHIEPVGDAVDEHVAPDIRVEPAGHCPKSKTLDLRARRRCCCPHDLMTSNNELSCQRHQRMEMPRPRSRCHENAYTEW
jgi:hypothetical protein